MYRFLLFIVNFCFRVAISTSTSTSTSTSIGRVQYLPGFQGSLPFHLETGYIGVDENEDFQLFYYFIQSESDPKNDPLILWITGGSGCSSISGLVYEIGMFFYLFMIANIIVIDIPIGTGFSYRRSAQASLIRNSFLILSMLEETHTLESGRPVPVVTQLISNGNEAGCDPYINLKGYLLGNPRSFPEEDNFQIRFANGMGLISDELYECIDGIEKPQILEPNCSAIVQPIKQPSQMQFEEQRPLSSFYCHDEVNDLMSIWANDGGVREALHIRKVHIELFQYDDICHREGKQSVRGGGHTAPESRRKFCHVQE
ncbi:Peptidase S10, serine carboxypeptidase, partial [Cynara cardunculus var. scolymus]